MWSCRFVLCALVTSRILIDGDAFSPQSPSRPRSSSTARKALWRHWIPEKQDFLWQESMNIHSEHPRDEMRRSVSNGVAAACMAFALVVAAPMTSLAVSGGGLDYANLDITGQDFSNGNYKGKDFTQVSWKNKESHLF